MTATARRVAGALVIAWYALVNFPGAYITATPGLDPSWQYALNVIHRSEWRFGRDIGFTYGPLGFLMEPRAVDNNLAVALAVETALHLLALAALFVWVRAGCLWRVAAFALLHSVFLSFGIWREYGLLSIVGLLMLTARQGLPGWRFWAACAGGIAAVGLFMKITLGLAAGSVLGLMALMHRRLAGWTVAAWCATAAVATLWNFSNAADLVHWLRMGWEISAHYGAAMSLPGDVRVLGLSLAAAVALISLGVSGTLRLAILPFVPSLVLAFKHGFMRQDGHPVAFFGYATAVAALLFLVTVRKRDGVHLAAVGLACALLTWANSAWFLSFPPVTAAGTFRHLAGAAGAERVAAAWNLSETHERLVAGMQLQIAPRRIPPAWRDRMLREGGGVTGLPWEVTEIHADGLPWRPIPTIQLYSAYSESLDRRTAEFFASPDRPRFVVLEMQALDGRALFLDTPQTVLALIQNYELAESGGARLLLRSRGQPLAGVGTPLRRWRTTWGQPVEVPDVRELERWRIRTELTHFGKLSRLLFRWPPVMLTARHRSGRTAEIRVLAATAHGGFLFPALPQSVPDFEDLLTGTIADPVESFTLEPPAWPIFRPEIWIERSTAPVLLAIADAEPEPVLENVQAIDEGGMEFSLSAAVTAGSRRARHVQFLVNTGLDGAGACYVSFDKAAGRFTLIADAGAGAAGFVMPGLEESAANSVCALDGSLSRVHRDGERLSVTVRVRFFPGFAGHKRLFATADMKTWVEGPAIDIRPGSCTVATGMPWPEAQDPPRVLHLLMGHRLDGTQACYLQFEPGSGAVTLGDDTAGGGVGLGRVGEEGALSNSQCRIPLAATRVERAGNHYRFSSPVEWRTGFPTPRRVFYQVEMADGTRTVWRTVPIEVTCGAP